MRETHFELKTSVLIVAGDRWQREVLAAALAYEGYRSEQADNTAGALTLLARQRFQLVLLDASTPAAGGWETVEKLILLHPDLPLIVLAPGVGKNFPALRNALQRALTSPPETLVIHALEREAQGASTEVGRGAAASSPLNE